MFGGYGHNGLRVRGMLRLRPGGFVSTGLGLFTGLVAAALVLVGLLAGRLSQGPLPVEMLKAPLTAGLESRVGNGFRFDIGEVMIEQSPRGFGLMIKSLAIRTAEGRLVVAAPKAQVEVDMLALVFGQIKPTRLELADLDVRVALAPSGAIALTAGTGQSDAIPLPVKPHAVAPGTAAVAGGDPLRILSGAVAALVGLVNVEKSPLGTLVRVGIAHGRLVIEDQTTKKTTVLTGFDLTFDRGEDGASSFSMAANGPNGRWSARATTADAEDQGHSVAVEFRDLSLAEIMLAGGIRDLPIATKMPLSARLHLAIDAKGALGEAYGDFVAGSGRLKIDDPDQQPFQIDEITGAFRLDPSKRRIALEKVHYFSGGTHLELGASVEVPHSIDNAWSFTVGGTGTFEPQAKSDAALQGSIEARGHIEPAARKLKLDALSLKGPAVDLTASGEAKADGTGPYFATRIVNGRPMPLRTFAPLWLSFLIPDLRDWFIHNVHDGQLETGRIDFRCDAACFKQLPLKLPLEPTALALQFSARNASVTAIEGSPPLSAISGSGRVDARHANFTGPTAAIVVGPNRNLKISDWAFNIPDITVEPIPAQASARMQGSMETLGEYLRGPAIAKYAKLPPETERFHGQVDTQVAMDLVLDKDAPDMRNMRANGRITGYAFDKFVADEKIENGNLTFSVDPAGIRAKGEARIFGVPATLDVKRSADGTGEAVIQASFDDAARLKRGIKLAGLTGPISMRATAPLGPDKPKAQIEADLTRAGIANLLPGWTKPAGKPCKATFTASQRADGVLLDGLSLDSGNLVLRGSAEVSLAAGLIGAKLSQLRLSPNDDMRVEVSRAGDGIRLQVHAAVFDARSLLRSVASMSGTGGSAAPGGLDPGKSIDLDLKALAVTGQNGKVMRNVDLKMSRKGSRIRQLKLTAKVGRGSLSASLGSGDSPLLRITATDAGAALAFFDFYKHMEAGSLDAAIRMGDDDHQDGSASIDHFVLHNEPAISRVTAETAQEGGAASSINLDPTAVAFTRFQTVFNRGAGRVSLHDTVMWGNEIGATVEGSVDFARDYVNLHGTFVPAYALNNIFSKIPFFGPLLGGGTNEGLFAVNYKVSGAASSPVVSINLLSAIAPGFLRQIFGAIDGTNTSQPSFGDDTRTQARTPFDFPSSDR